MEIAFYIAGAVAVLSTILMLTRSNVVHALLYLIVSLLSVAVVFYTFGAPFVAALEVIVYAGAIMVLFVFVVMMLNLGAHAVEREKALLTPGIWTGPSILACILITEVFYMVHAVAGGSAATPIEPKQVGIALFGPYLIGVELASLLLLAGVVGAYHVGYRQARKTETRDDGSIHERRAAAGGDLVLARTHEPARTT